MTGLEEIIGLISNPESGFRIVGTGTNEDGDVVYCAPLQREYSITELDCKVRTLFSNVPEVTSIPPTQNVLIMTCNDVLPHKDGEPVKSKNVSVQCFLSLEDAAEAFNSSPRSC